MVLECSVTAVPVGSRVRIEIVARNPDPAPYEVDTHRDNRAEVRIARGGTTIWEWTSAIDWSVPIGPGERRRVECWWENPGPGKYDVSGRVSMGSWVGEGDTTVLIAEDPTSR